MQKATTVLLGALVLALTILVIWWAGPRTKPTAPPSAIPSVPEPLALPSAVPSSGPGPLASLFRDTTRPSPEVPGSRLLDGSVPPALPVGAPRSLRFGVVLVQYKGAQRAPVHGRSKAEALELARELLTLARTDFKAAVQKGDPGSAADLGRIEVNILEPAPNYVLFTLPPGGVGGPVDTPTGYWILKNLSKSADGRR